MSDVIIQLTKDIDKLLLLFGRQYLACVVLET